MGNAQKKKLAAERHNALFDEDQAYREDRKRDPDKYRRPNKRMSPVVLAAICTALNSNGVNV